jgi:hypothetical protein
MCVVLSIYVVYIWLQVGYSLVVLFHLCSYVWGMHGIMAVLPSLVYLSAQHDHVLFQDRGLHHTHHFVESRGIKVMNLGVILNLREVCRVLL